MSDTTQQTPPGQVPPTPPTPPAQNTPPAPTPPPAPDAAGLAARMAQLEATIAQQNSTITKLNDENAQRRIETKQQREAREAAEVATGNFKGKAERLETDLTALQQQVTGLTAKAQQWDTYEQSRTAAVEAEGKALPAQWQPLWAMTQGLPAKEALLAGFKASQPTTPLPSDPPKQPAPPAPPGGAPPPPPGTTTSVDPRTMSPAELQHMQATNPEQYNKLFGRSEPEKSKGGLLGFLKR